MGLCKCPKKKVTNLFCYEHRVNVCQYCMVKHHSKCIVQSYLLWLQDSDYDPNCLLCGDKLVSDECVRLVCLHIFHWKCLDRKCRRLPSTTAPAGYTCPVCGESIFPLDNIAMPVADYLRDKLSTVNWARIALGLPSFTEGASQNNELKPLLSSSINDDYDDGGVDDKKNIGTKPKDDLIVFMDETVYTRPEESAQMPRRIVSHLPSTRFLLNQDDEIKDRRGNPLIHLSRYFWRRIRNIGRNRYGPCKLILAGVIVMTLLCTIFTVLGSIVTENDPMFDPAYNPHVHLNKEPS